ncbi:hypothetical protein BDP67DRAFT_512879 [Colletotrichum lupini]|nr:hypothetical protein BDP67DRAFT_512879 [Colletotrichum lupini]
MHLNAARSFANRVPFDSILRMRSSDFPEQAEDELWWTQDGEFWVNQLEGAGAMDLSPSQVVSDAKVLRELECLVRALDTMETVASLAELSREDPSVKRDFWAKVGNEVKAAKEHVRPLLVDWLGDQEDQDLQALREAYLSETILAYISTLHFAGTTLTRDNLLECMELAATIAEKGSDVAECFAKAKRMKELVECFAACSKALAVASGEKKAANSSSKKLREMGWSRDLWSVKH